MPIKTVKESSAWDLLDTLRVLVYGESGTGKTTFWSTFPGPIKVLLCSGGNRVGELKSIDTPEMRKKIKPVVISSIDQARKEADSCKGNFTTVVLDHVTSFCDLALSEIIGRPVPEQKSWGLASQQQYGQQALNVKDFCRRLLDLPCNVVIIGQERVFQSKDEDNSEILKPTVAVAASPSIASWLNPACDYVVQTFKRPKLKTKSVTVGGKVIEQQVRDKGVDYCLRCEPHEVYMTKFRCPVGSEMPDVIVNPTYEKLLAATRGDEPN